MPSNLKRIESTYQWYECVPCKMYMHVQFIKLRKNDSRAHRTKFISHMEELNDVWKLSHLVMVKTTSRDILQSAHQQFSIVQKTYATDAIRDDTIERLNHKLTQTYLIRSHHINSHPGMQYHSTCSIEIRANWILNCKDYGCFSVEIVKMKSNYIHSLWKPKR